MKKSLLLWSVLLSAGMATAQTTGGSKTPARPAAKPTTKPATKPAARPASKPATAAVQGPLLKNLADSAGYALGVDVASSLKSQKMEAINRPLITKGLNDVLAGKPSLIDENECFLILNNYATLCMQPEGYKPTAPKAGTAAAKAFLKNLPDSAGYALGVNIGTSLKLQDMTSVNRNLIQKGLDDLLGGKQVLLSPQESYSILSRYSQKMAQEKAVAVIADGEAFLAENKKRAEVKTTASGLQYEILKEGTGIKPTAQDTFVVHYRGTRIDGFEFDASYRRNEPLIYPMSAVIAGWTEGLQLMPAGSKYKFYIPYQLGYGLRGAPPDIPGGAALIFEIELLDVKKNPNQ